MLGNGAKFFDATDPVLKLDPVNCIGHYQAAAQGQEHLILLLYHRLEDATVIAARKVVELGAVVDRRMRFWAARARESRGDFAEAETTLCLGGPHPLFKSTGNIAYIWSGR